MGKPTQHYDHKISEAQETRRDVGFATETGMPNFRMISFHMTIFASPSPVGLGGAIRPLGRMTVGSFPVHGLLRGCVYVSPSTDSSTRAL